MTLEQAFTGAGAEEPAWDVVYADQAPRVYNYFRFRSNTHSFRHVAAINNESYPGARSLYRYLNQAAGSPPARFGPGLNPMQKEQLAIIPPDNGTPIAQIVIETIRLQNTPAAQLVP